MTKIVPELLNDTLSVVQLAREAALVRGNKEQAERLSPVADNLRDLVSTARQTKPLAPHGGVLGQSDFQTMLAAMQTAPQATNSTSSSSDRNQIVSAMSEAGMAEVDIARHMGIARDEVRLILNIMNKNKSSSEVIE